MEQDKNRRGWMSRWYRAYEGTVNDVKLAEAAMVADVSRAVSVAAWHALLESAAALNNCGSFEITPRRVSIILCEPPAALEALFAAYAEVGLIEDGVILSWKKRQYESDDSKERVAKHRAKKRQETAGNEPVTACNGDVTPPETEAETETEVSEPNGSSPRAWACPVGVDPQVWKDLLSNRKRKRQGNTPTAWKRFNDDLTRVSMKTGIPPPKLIEHAAASGWAGIYDPNERSHCNERPDNPIAIAVQRLNSGIG